MVSGREAASAYFFFQAEDGIRDLTVTGVQTCALPIYCHLRNSAELHEGAEVIARGEQQPDGHDAGRKTVDDNGPGDGFGFEGESLCPFGKIGRASCRERVKAAGRGASLKERRIVKWLV